MIERHFLGWHRPLLPLAAEFLRERYLAEGVLDLREVCLVLPGARAGRRLKELLLDEATAAGVRFIPPRIVLTRELAELFYCPDLPPAGEFLARRVWASVLRDSAKSAVEQLFGELPADDDLRGWDRLARRIASVHREVSGGGHSFLDVAAVCERSADLLFDDSARWRLLADVERQYLRQIGTLGLSDVDAERRERFRGLNARQGEPGPSVHADIWLVGVVELPAAVAGIVERSENDVGVLLHAPPEEAAGFDALGLCLPAAWRTRALDVPDTVVIPADLPGDQAAAVLDGLAGLGDARTADVAVAIPDAALVPMVREWLEAAGLPVHWGGGRKLDRTRPFRLLEALGRYLETGEWEEFASLCRHPDISRWLAGREGLSPPMEPGRLDRVFADHLPARIAAPVTGDRRRGAGRSIKVPAPVRALADRLEGEPSVRALREPRVRGLTEWPVPLLEFLTAVYEAVLAAPGAAGAGGGRHRTSFREVTDVLGKIRDAAISLYRLPPELSPKCDAAAAIRLLLDECSTASVPDDPDGAPIELLGWLEAVIDDAPHLFVVGMNEGSLPASSAGDPFLPERLRARLGIADDSSRYARDAMHLAAAMHSRESVRLVAGRRDTRGDPRRPSRLLLTGAGEALAWRVRALTAEQADGNTRPAPILVAAGSESGFALPPEPVLTFTVPSRLSVTGIRGVLQDPYRYVLEGVLGLERRDDDARELDPLAFGSLAHEVLGRFGHSDDRDSTDADRIADRLDAFLDEALRRRYTVTFPAVALQIEQLRFRLRAFARWQADRTVAGWRIIVVEGVPVRQGGEVDSSITLAAATSEVPFDVDGDPITLHGRIDRIDHHPDRGWAIFDYKTGDDVAKPNALHLEGGRWVDAQLPLYRHIARAISAENGDPVIPADAVVGLGYIALPRDPEETGAQMAEWSEDDLSSADEAVREAVRFIRRGVVEFTGLDGPAQAWDSLGILLGGRLLSAGIAGEGSADEGEGGDE